MPLDEAVHNLEPYPGTHGAGDAGLLLADGDALLDVGDLDGIERRFAASKQTGRAKKNSP